LFWSKGKIEGDAEVALRLHAAGLSAQEISNFAGFTPAELQKLLSRH